LCSLSIICLACTLPYTYNLVHVVFGTIPTSFNIFENVFHTCYYHCYYYPLWEASLCLDLQDDQLPVTLVLILLRVWLWTPAAWLHCRDGSGYRHTVHSNYNTHVHTETKDYSCASHLLDYHMYKSKVMVITWSNIRQLHTVGILVHEQ